MSWPPQQEQQLVVLVLFVSCRPPEALEIRIDECNVAVTVTLSSDVNDTGRTSRIYVYMDTIKPHGFWNPPCLGPWSQNVGSSCFCGPSGS